ncbi:triose-phosphate isomerase [Burkholderiaceae bacterium DAT-1]|nr:triose-phosphate isomerase [Burkholderiaceae bacterium DAT-1]
MNGSSLLVDQIVDRLSSSSFDVDVTLCVPFPYLVQVRSRVADHPIGVGAQDCDERESGAYTGQVSVAMLDEVGCDLVILGHSERREYFAETNIIVSRKIKVALAAGLRVVLCVGEALKQRDEGSEKAFIAEQLSVLNGLTDLSCVSIAYEPIWAIGTGRTAELSQIAEMHGFIKSVVNVPVLYGGSVKSSNVASIVSVQDVDGVLVGGASLVPEEFVNLCRNAG